MTEINLNLEFEGKRRYRHCFRRDPAMTHFVADIRDAFTFGYKDISEKRFLELLKETQ